MADFVLNYPKLEAEVELASDDSPYLDVYAQLLEVGNPLMWTVTATVTTWPGGTLISTQDMTSQGPSGIYKANMYLGDDLPTSLPPLANRRVNVNATFNEENGATFATFKAWQDAESSSSEPDPSSSSSEPEPSSSSSPEPESSSSSSDPEPSSSSSEEMVMMAKSAKPKGKGKKK